LLHLTFQVHHAGAKRSSDARKAAGMYQRKKAGKCRFNLLIVHPFNYASLYFVGIFLFG
jgi:hypothetical protein